jgi:hypothetical protein
LAYHHRADSFPVGGVGDGEYGRLGDAATTGENAGRVARGRRRCECRLRSAGPCLPASPQRLSPKSAPASPFWERRKQKCTKKAVGQQYSNSPTRPRAYRSSPTMQADPPSPKPFERPMSSCRHARTAPARPPPPAVPQLRSDRSPPPRLDQPNEAVSRSIDQEIGRRQASRPDVALGRPRVPLKGAMLSGLIQE